jgi:hypothetical protein
MSRIRISFTQWWILAVAFSICAASRYVSLKLDDLLFTMLAVSALFSGLLGYVAGTTRYVLDNYLKLFILSAGFALGEFAASPSTWPRAAPIGSDYEWLFLVLQLIAFAASTAIFFVVYLITQKTMCLRENRCDELVCNSCGYCLIGLASNRCPECGTSISATTSRS